MSTGAPAVNGANVVFAADDSASASSADETALPGAALGQPADVPPMKYILITGGVISGVGKGIIASSLGVILKAHGLGVSAIKIDPYINIDAGTFSPYEHGEVYVLDDGGEVDLDLGNYERFLDVRLTRDNNLTTGKVYDWVIKRERKGDYLGKTVQVVPHVTDAIQDWVARVATIPVDGTGKRPDVCIIELGGTIGDIEGMPFVEAFRQLQFRARREHFMNVHVSLVLEPKATGEQKTKPTQNSVRELRCLGLFPDMVVCRSATPLQESVRRKVSHFCDVEVDKVICVHDVSNIYHVPLLLHAQNSLALLADRLHLRLPVAMSALSDKPTAHWTDRMRQWHQLATRCDRLHDTVSIALVGKYVTLQDAYTSVSKALQHAATAANRRLTIHYVDSEHLQNEHRDRKPAEYHDAWKILTTADGILVPGGFGDRGVEGKIEACKWARERNTPMLGICLGMQCAVIEFARNVAGLKEAHSTEFVKSSAVSRPSECVVVDMPEHSAATDAQGMGATMRLGLRRTVFLTKHCVTRKLYSRLSDTNRRSGCVDERHRHRYEVNPEHVPALADLGLRFVAMGVDNKCTSKLGGANEKEESVKGMEEQLSALLIDEEKLEKACVSVANTERDGELRATLRHICVDGAMGRHTAVRMEIVELADHPFYVGVQFHPEYMSHPLRPSAPYLGLVLAASGQLQAFLDGSRIPSPLATPKHSDYSVAANLNVLGAK